MSLEGKAAADSVLRGKINGLDTLVIDAYDIAVKHGFEGTEEEWLESLTEQTKKNAAEVIEQADNAVVRLEDTEAKAVAHIESMAEETLNIVQNPGNSATAVMSQKAVTKMVTGYISQVTEVIDDNLVTEGESPVETESGEEVGVDNIKLKCQDEVDAIAKRTIVTAEEQGYLKELYLEGVDAAREVVVGQVANCFYVDGADYYYSSFALAYKDTPTTWIALWQEHGVSGESAYEDELVLKLTAQNSSGVSGYAVVNFNEVVPGTRIYPKIAVNVAKATSLDANPIISAHINDSIIKFNKDKEPLIIGQSKTRATLFGDSKKVLQFIHFSDIHSDINAWSRIVHYMREYADYIKFAVMTGDYCAGAHDTWTDLYAYADNGKMYNCVGNHDFITDATTQTTAAAEDTYNKLFATSGMWGVNFPTGSNLMYYYKDFAECGIRLIVLDQFYWDDAEATWLQNTLANAKSNNLSVITASHWQSGTFENMLDCSFNTFDDYTPHGQFSTINTPFEPIITNFVASGGTHIVHLSGHWHHDMTGYTTNGILNTVVECATRHGEPWKNTVRVPGTRTADCFNVVGVDVTNRLLKIIRIGNNTDGYLQPKNVLCINYEAKTVVSNY